MAIKNNEKHQKLLPEIPEEAQHKKKSLAKGRARSKHKHEYKTVLLHSDYYLTKPHDPHPWRVLKDRAVKVCSVCGRIGDIDEHYYKACGPAKVTKTGIIFGIGESKLAEEARTLEKWYCNDINEKYAYRMEGTEN